MRLIECYVVCLSGADCISHSDFGDAGVGIETSKGEEAYAKDS
jgi:hypothetical protein